MGRSFVLYKHVLVQKHSVKIKVKVGASLFADETLHNCKSVLMCYFIRKNINFCSNLQTCQCHRTTYTLLVEYQFVLVSLHDIFEINHKYHQFQMTYLKYNSRKILNLNFIVCCCTWPISLCVLFPSISSHGTLYKTFLLLLSVYRGLYDARKTLKQYVKLQHLE